MLVSMIFQGIIGIATDKRNDPKRKPSCFPGSRKGSHSYIRTNSLLEWAIAQLAWNSELLPGVMQNEGSDGILDSTLRMDSRCINSFYHSRD